MESFQVILPAKQAVRCHYVHSAHGTTSTIRKFGHLTIERSHVSKVSTSQIFQPGENRPVPCERGPRSKNRAIFVWPWNENARTKQKQQTKGNRAIWLVYRTDTNARGFWLVKRTLGWKNFMPENFLEINRYFALTSYCNTTGQSNNAFSILGFSLVGKRRGRVFIFPSIGW